MIIHRLSRVSVLAGISIWLILSLAQPGYGDAEGNTAQAPTYTLAEQWPMGRTGDARFEGPNAIVIDSADNILVTEFAGNRVRKRNSRAQ